MLGERFLSSALPFGHKQTCRSSKVDPLVIVTGRRTCVLFPSYCCHTDRDLGLKSNRSFVYKVNAQDAFLKNCGLWIQIRYVLEAIFGGASIPPNSIVLRQQMREIGGGTHLVDEVEAREEGKYRRLVVQPGYGDVTSRSPHEYEEDMQGHNHVAHATLLSYGAFKRINTCGP